MAASSSEGDFDLSQFRDSFFEESAEHLAAMEQGLLALDADASAADDPELLNAIFRAAHSIKGVAASLGFEEIAAFTHVLEELLDAMRRGQVAPTPARVQLLLRATDMLRAIVDASRANAPFPEASADVSAALRQELEAGDDVSATGAADGRDVLPVRHPSHGHADAAAWWEIRFAPKSGMFLTGQDPLLVVRELVGLGDEVQVVTDTTRVPLPDALKPDECHVGWTIRLRTSVGRAAIEEAFLFVEDVSVIEIRQVEVEVDVEADPVAPASATPDAQPVADAGERRGAERRDGDRRESGERRAAPAMEASSIRVPIDKIDALVDLVGELVIAQAMVNQIADNFTIERLGALQDALVALDRNTRDLQERVMAVRMLPVSTVFSRFPRLVRDLAGKLGKKVRLEMAGSETELDKGMLERLGDPLTHIVRNAIDHGLETPDERRTAGKHEEGVVTLRAATEGGSVVIEVAEDGRGLNTTRIREKAVANGLIAADDQLSTEEIHALIFAPGFSTAATVSDVSGRGVGMDVVKKNVEALNGSVTIHSEPGKGSRFRIRLPLTLAILDGLIVKVGGESYVLPLLSVVESLRPAPRDVREVLGKGEILLVRGESLPFVRLHALFGHADAVTEPSSGIVVVIESEERRFGLLVDELLGQQQVVIKNLESNFRKLDAIMGATILGDGRIALIADVQELHRIATQRRFGADAGAFAVSQSFDESL